jgi:hypothetical protein
VLALLDPKTRLFVMTTAILLLGFLAFTTFSSIVAGAQLKGFEYHGPTIVHPSADIAPAPFWD